MKHNNPASKEHKTHPKVFDVMKPGAAAPSSSARPLVVTHRPMVQDPMVTTPPIAQDNTPDVIGGAKQEPLLRPRKIKLEPSPEAIQALAEQAVVQKKAAGQEHEPTPLKLKNEAVESAPSEPTPPESEAEPPTADLPGIAESKVAFEDKSGANESEAPAAPASLVAPVEDQSVSASDQTTPQTTAAESVSDATKPTTPKQATDQISAKQNAAETARQAELEATIDSKKYFVHIATPLRRRSLRAAVIGAVVIIIVGLGCIDAMLDAGVLTISGVPHTHFAK